MVKIGELRKHPSNPNTHPERQIELLGKIIREQGWRAPITVSNRSGYIVRGHGRLQAAQWLGLKTVPVDRQDYESDEAELADLIADNRIAELAIIDDEMLVDLIGDLGQAEIDMELTGFDAAGMTDFVGEWEREKKRTEAAARPPEKEIPASIALQKKWNVKRGDVWTLGDHKLICGDCLEVMGEMEGVDCIVADPPYGMNWNTDMTRWSGGNRRRGKGVKRRSIAGDDKPFDPSPFLKVSEVILWGVNHFSERLPTGTTLVWIKRNEAQYETFLSDAEIAWMKGGHGVYCRRDMSLSSKYADSTKKYPDKHPSEKPVGIMEWCIGKCKSDIIHDPYAGSGTTMIACENLGKKCVSIEIDPGYCSVILERFATLTGKIPTLTP
jgi:site-specific DNA-methyltransferase (adenine-specific)/modification methylase